MASSVPLEFQISTSILAEDIVRIARAAGDAILEVYNNPDSSALGVEQKSDSSPLTIADKRANALICDELQRLYPHIPIVSEENKLVPFHTRKGYQYFWVVDPLDGTKEFIKRNGQFTVNIGLVKGTSPILGVVHTPCQNRTHWAAKGQGAYLREGSEEDKKIVAATFSEADEGLTIVGSASHSTKETEDFIAKYKGAKRESLGSSLKLMLVAEGRAHVYPRLALTSEWDTCASQIIVEEAGGEVLQYPGFEPVVYGKENPLNPFFVVYGKRSS
eukprot:jgi/Mesen1/511/ME000104S10598